MSQKPTFTPEEKEACLPIIDRILECSNIARQYGVLALEEFVQKQDNDFLTFGTMLIVDGTDPCLVKGILQTLICSDNHTGFELLSREIIAEGVLSVQAGENPRLLELKLLSMLGEEYLRKRGAFPGVTLPDFHEVKQQLSKILRKGVKCEDFSRPINDLSHRDIQQILREVDQRDFGLALLGSEEDVAIKLFSNVSPRLTLMVLSDMELMTWAKENDILEAQQKIADVIKRLCDIGEIVYECVSAEAD